MKRSMFLVRKCVWLALGWALLSTVLAVKPAEAADFKPNSTYLFMVNGLKLEKRRTQGKYASSVAYNDLKKYMDEALMGHRLYQRANQEMAPLASLPFLIEMTTDKNGDIATVIIEANNNRINLADAPKPAENPQGPPPQQPMRTAKVEPPQPRNLPPPPTDGPTGQLVRQYVVVNRKATPQEKQQFPRLVECNYEQLAEVKEQQPERKDMHERILAEVASKNLTGVPFTLSWDEDSNHVPFGELTITAGDASIPLAVKKTPEPTDPDTELPEAVAVTLESLQNDAKDANLKGLMAKRLLTFAVSGPADQLKCKVENQALQFENKEVGTLFASAGIQTVKNLTDNTTVDLLKPLAEGLRREQRLALFGKKQDATHCLAPLYNEMWSRIWHERRKHLLWDFKQVLSEVHAERAKLEFVGETHKYQFKQPELQVKLSLLEDMLMDFTPKEFAEALPKRYRYDTTIDNNDNSDDSRKEPIDILSYSFGADRYEEISKLADIGTVMRTAIVKNAIKHVLAPEWYPAQYFISGSTEEYKRDHGANFFVFCSGGALTATNATADMISGNKLVQYLRVSEARLAEMKAQRSKIKLTCDSLAADMSVPEEYVKVALRSPINDTFRFGDDNKIKAVSTFFLVNSASPGFVTAMKVGSGIQGYVPVSQSTPQDVKAAFLEDLLDTDFYFPAVHKTNSETFSIAYTGSSRLVLHKQLPNNRVVEVICYVPPERPGQREITVSAGEIAEIFRKRRALPVQRRMLMMNVACESRSCVPQWQKSYEMSLMNQTFSPEQVEALPGEYPVFIGATRSFNTGSTDLLLDHAKYPFSALDIAGQERSISDLINFLSNTQGDKSKSSDNKQYFGPVSNLGDSRNFDVESRRQRVGLLIVTVNGTRITD